MLEKVAFTMYPVRDVERARAFYDERLAREGVTFKAKMIHSPVCRMTVILDSEGNSVILHELKNKKRI
jgi:predicted enzyme related to lactoylglutathione lyase